MVSDAELRITPDDGQGFVELNPSEVSHGPLRSLRAAVQISAAGFAGNNDSVWLAERDLQQFFEQLSTLDRLRLGAAVLRSMSPDEFVLGIATVDRAGHMMVSIELRHVVYVIGQPYTMNVGIGFALDSSALPSLVQVFRAYPLVLLLIRREHSGFVLDIHNVGAR